MSRTLSQIEIDFRRRMGHVAPEATSPTTPPPDEVTPAPIEPIEESIEPTSEGALVELDEPTDESRAERRARRRAERAALKAGGAG